MSYQYKSKDGEDFFIPGVGKSINGIITSEKPLNGANLVFIEQTQPTAPIDSVATAQPAAVIGVAPQATATQTDTTPKTENQ